MAEGYATSLTTTSQFTVEIPEFCIVDNIKIYKIVVDALKGYISPYSLICRGTFVNSELVSCQDFVTGIGIQQVSLE